jgi:CDP-glycerol glycerophosphotransferase (TagB/SpsB family)
VIITFASTLAIDAIVFNKPVIFIGFDGKPDCEYWESLRRFYDFDHQRSLLDADGIKLANSLNELIEYVKSYIHNSDLDKEEREKIINDRCWKLDGKSSERLAYVLIRFLESCYRDDSN